MELIDTYGRRINYLRLSVTDRCNLRCSYCMPSGGVPALSHHDVLSYEQMHRVAREAVELGIEKIRITGGEPLVRRGLVGFLERLSTLPGLKELVLTTNGVLLKEMALPLRQAGVQRLNVSLDSLRPEVFAAITRRGDLDRVLQGIEAAEQAGFLPLKINMVVMRGVNDRELLDFAALTLEKPYLVRFIEYMPTLNERGWESLSVTGKEILERLGERYHLLPAVGSQLAGPSRNYRIQGAAGGIGIITPVSGHFCESCNRIRVTSTGRARSCLFSGGGMDLRPYLEEGDAPRLREALRTVVAGKPGRQDPEASVAMSQVGG